MATRISEFMRDRSYLYSVELAKERGAFPLFNADMYLSGGNFASRLPPRSRSRSASTACATRTCCRSRRPAPSAWPSPTTPATASSRPSPGPTRARSAWPTAPSRNTRSRTTPGACTSTRAAMCPSCPTTSSPRWKSRRRPTNMVAAVAPYVDTSISKTVNVPADYPYADFEDLYLVAWKSGLKGLATYRPNSVLGSVLSVGAERSETAQKQPQDVTIDRRQPAPVDRRPARPGAGQPALARPPAHDRRQSAWTYMIETPHGEFALFVGQIENEWAAPCPSKSGSMAPSSRAARRRGQDPVDGHARQRQGLAQAQARRPGAHAGDDSFDMPLAAQRRAQAGARRGLRPGPGGALPLRKARRPRTDRGPRRCSTACSAARNPRPAPTARCLDGGHPVNPASGEDFVLGLKEITLPDGVTRPYSVWLSGHYPRALDGLTRMLSLDMRVMDPAWIGMKLRKLLNYPSRWATSWPSSPAPQAAELALDRRLHRAPDHPPLRHARHPRRERLPDARNGHPRSPARRAAAKVMQGSLCTECGNYTVIRKDGCDFCTACGAVGSCG
jgi:ribonucleoside-diphosphate reductase alpha chain